MKHFIIKNYLYIPIYQIIKKALKNFYMYNKKIRKKIHLKRK